MVSAEELALIGELETIIHSTLPKIEKIYWTELKRDRTFGKLRRLTKNNYGIFLNKDHVIGIGFSSPRYRLKGLDYDDFIAQDFPKFLKTICGLRFLEFLDLSHIGRFEIPECFGKLKNLRVLNLSWNRFKKFPPILRDLTNLEILDVNTMGLSTIPESILKLPNLKELNLEQNKLQNLPEAFSNLKSLEVLNLKLNPLTTLPKSFGNLTKLRELYIGGFASRTTELSKLPSSFGNLTRLEILDLEKNLLTHLPNSFGNLSALKVLYLYQNQLASLPETMGNLTQLKELRLHRNKLRSIPDTISNLTNLKVLFLQYNKLTKLPETIWQLKNLEQFNIFENMLERKYSGLKKGDSQSMLKFCRHIAPINLYINCALTDFDAYNIEQIAANLEIREEIKNCFYYNRPQKRGPAPENFETFIKRVIPSTHIFLFLVTEESLNTYYCLDALDKAFEANIKVIPLLGDVGWEDDRLKKMMINRELGLTFKNSDLENVCENIYQYICSYKREKNVFERTTTSDKIEHLISVSTDIFEELIESELSNFLRSNPDKLAELWGQLCNDVDVIQIIKRVISWISQTN